MYRPGRVRPHTQIGQQGQHPNRHNGRQNQAPGGMPVGAGAAGGQSTVFDMGGMPKYPPAPPAFLPATPGFEASRRAANDALTGAEGAYATSGIMLPAQLGLQKQRLDTDMGVATDRLKEDLAGRGVFTARGADYNFGTGSPAGGGVGQTLYGRNVATPFGRQYQDLAAQGAGAYGDRAGALAGAELGYNQNIFQGLLGSANEAFQAQPLSLPIGGYNLPHQAMPNFSSPPSGRPGLGRPGRTRPRHGGR